MSHANIWLGVDTSAQVSGSGYIGVSGMAEAGGVRMPGSIGRRSRRRHALFHANIGLGVDTSAQASGGEDIGASGTAEAGEARMTRLSVVARSGRGVPCCP